MAAGPASSLASPPTAIFHRKWRCEAPTCSRLLVGARHHCRQCGASVCSRHFSRPLCFGCVLNSGQSLVADADVGMLPLSVLFAAYHRDSDRRLSEEIFAYICQIKGQHEALDQNGCLAIRVQPDEEWLVIKVEEQRVAGTARAGDTSQCDAYIDFSSESAFEALVDGRLGTAVAVATGRLRVSGSRSLLSAGEALLSIGEEGIRAEIRGMPIRRSALALAETEQVAAARSAALEQNANVLQAPQRTTLRRLLLRHAGTEQQVGSLLLVFGSVLYLIYTLLTMAQTWPADALVNTAYVLAAALWLVGSVYFTAAAYPERVLELVVAASSAASSVPSRDDQNAPCCGSSPQSPGSCMLVGAKWYELGAAVFAAGAAAALFTSYGDVTAWLYLASSVYFCLSTALLVYSLRPASLAANYGEGSTIVADACAAAVTRWPRCAQCCAVVSRVAVTFGCGGCFECTCSCALGEALRQMIATDSLAGTASFAGFMIVCVGYALIDFLANPSTLSAFFVATQLPFVVGSILLYRASSPSSINRAFDLWATQEQLISELEARGLLQSSVSGESRGAGSRAGSSQRELRPSSRTADARAEMY